MGSNAAVGVKNITKVWNPFAAISIGAFSSPTIPLSAGSVSKNEKSIGTSVVGEIVHDVSGISDGLMIVAKAPTSEFTSAERLEGNTAATGAITPVVSRTKIFTTAVADESSSSVTSSWKVKVAPVTGTSGAVNDAWA